MVELGIDGTTYTCLVKATQRDPVTANLLHVDFFEVDDNENVLVVVPVTTTGKAPGVVAGGKLRLIKRDLKVRCKPGAIPESVPVDVSSLNIGDFIRVSRVAAPESTEIVAPNDFNVLTVIGKRGAMMAAEEVDEGQDGAEEGGQTEEAGE